MAYRGEDARDVLEAPTLDGKLEVSLGANRIALTVGHRTLHLTDQIATVTESVGKTKKPRRVSYAITGIVLARGIPREDLGLWIEAKEDRETARDKAKAQDKDLDRRRRLEQLVERGSLRRLFGINPVSLFDKDGLPALAKLDAAASRLRIAIDEYARGADLWSARGVEIGSGHVLDKVLLADFGDHHAVYARKLFRDRARLLALVHHDGKVIVPDAKATHEVQVMSRFGVTVRGDYVRFADKTGTDQARIALPWVGPEDREELARRIGTLVHRQR